ncbi:MAG: hypothetical protein KDB82_01520 [Planctomycetes bacterium]|nr:hypothetical protein [Planctomycetota bacterium]
MSDFQVIPAIELRGGMALRYESVGMGTRANRVEPLGFARKFIDAGAKTIHIYNLDGPFIVSQAEHSGSVLAGAERNLTVVGEMAKTFEETVQLSGGIRDIESFKVVTQLGVNRAAFGSAAMHDPSLIHKALEINAEAVVVFLDVKDGRVVSQEWVKDSKATVADIAGAIQDAGVRHFIYQDVTADATGHGPRAGEASSFASDSTDVIVTGGVTRLEHIKEVASTRGVHGVLVGKPLMMEEFTYEEAVAAAKEGLAARG